MDPTRDSIFLTKAGVRPNNCNEVQPSPVYSGKTGLEKAQAHITKDPHLHCCNVSATTGIVTYWITAGKNATVQLINGDTDTTFHYATVLSVEP